MKKSILAIFFAVVLFASVFSFNAYAAQMTDGLYEVNIALWHSEDDKESMAADAIGTKATIEVKNGVKTMHITSGEMSMMGIKASLQELRIADENGNFTDAKVESKNEEGNPTGFYFTMPHTDEYITVKVNPHLAIMGNKDIGARIKVDYSTLKLIKAAQATVSEVSTTVVNKEITVISANGETNTEPATIETTSLQSSEVKTEVEEITQTIQADEAQIEKNNISVFFVIIAVVAAFVIFIVIKKKITK